MAFNFFDKEDKIKMALQSLSCESKTSAEFKCFVDVAGSQDYMIDYTLDKTAAITATPIKELTVQRTLTTINGYDLKGFQKSEDFMVMSLKRVEESKKTEGKEITDCPWLLAAYRKGKTDDPYTILTCDELKVPNYSAAPMFAIDGRSTNSIWLSVPRPTGGSVTELTPISLFTVTPATVTPLEYKPTPTPTPTSGSTTRRLLAEKKLADFSKVSIGVVGLDKDNKVTPATLTKLDPKTSTTDPKETGSGLGIFWWILIIFAVLALVGAIVFFMGQKSDDAGNNYVKNNANASLDDSEIDNAL
jgi:hypothetical protein